MSRHVDHEKLARQGLEMMQTLGVTIDDLRAVAEGAEAPQAPQAPRVAEYVAHVRGLYPNARTRATYEPGWRRLVEAFGDRRLTDVKASELRRLANEVAEESRRDDEYRATDGVATGRGSGIGAMENAVNAFRAVYKHAVADELVAESANPARKVDKPKRRPSPRRPLTRAEYVAVLRAARADHVDPWAATLVVRFLYETGARTGGLLGVRLANLNRERQTVTLPSEKNDKQLEQPVSRELLEHLFAFAAERGATEPHHHVFLQRPRGRTPARPVTERWVEELFKRIRAQLPDDVDVHVTPHWLRHTANRRMQRIAGTAVAERFLGHEPSTMNHLYSTPLPGEVAAAWARLHGVDHPLADEQMGW